MSPFMSEIPGILGEIKYCCSHLQWTCIVRIYR